MPEAGFPSPLSFTLYLYIFSYAFIFALALSTQFASELSSVKMFTDTARQGLEY